MYVHVLHCMHFLQICRPDSLGGNSFRVLWPKSRKIIFRRLTNVYMCMYCMYVHLLYVLYASTVLNAIVFDCIQAGRTKPTAMNRPPPRGRMGNMGSQARSALVDLLPSHIPAYWRSFVPA